MNQNGWTMKRVDIEQYLSQCDKLTNLEPLNKGQIPRKSTLDLLTHREHKLITKAERLINNA